MARGLGHRRGNSARAVRKTTGVRALENLTVTDRPIGRCAAAPGLCSCWMCGNQRRYFGPPTLQQQRARLTVE